MNVLGEISDITIYPIKSLPGVKIDRAVLTKYGIAHPDNKDIIDRKWMIVDENGSFRTQRQFPKMALISITIEGQNFILKAPNNKTIKIAINPENVTKKKCRVFNLDIYGYAYEKSVGKWFSEVLETENLDLVVFKNDLEPRKVKDINRLGNNGRENDHVIYEDYSPFMLISENSLNELNSRLEKKVTMRSFRPNFVAKDCDQFAEDNWQNFYIGKSQFATIKNCTRCLLTTVDPDLGIKDPKQQPLSTLNEFRLNKPVYDTSPMFGINFAIANESFEGDVIHIGDKITK